MVIRKKTLSCLTVISVEHEPFSVQIRTQAEYCQSLWLVILVRLSKATLRRRYDKVEYFGALSNTSLRHLLS